MSTLKPILCWLRTQRSSTRVGFGLQMIFRVLTSVFSLVWTPLLLGSMGRALNGAFLSFQSLASLGGLGDLGMGGMVSIQTSRLLGQGNESELRLFLARVRALFLLLALVSPLVFLAVSPHLFETLKFENVSGVGSLPLLAAVGAVAVGLLILNSYITNLNYGCSNITWPIVPGFVALQLGFLGHWLLARQHCALWAQYAPYVLSGLLVQWTGWWFIRSSHPALATVRPLAFEGKQFLSLAGKSFWVYLYCVAAGLNMTVDRLLINLGFGPAMVPPYQYNYRLCELAMFVVVSASLASMPKITQWLASPDAGLRERARHESERLNKFQTFLGCAAVLVYLAVNDWFIGFWLGKDLQVPLVWQVAFAAILAVSAAGYAGVDLAARCCDQGLRVGGITMLLAALLNLGLSWVAMRRGSVLGIAAATVIAQSATVLFLGWFACRKIKMSWWRLSLRNWLLGLAMVAAGWGMRQLLPMDDVWAILMQVVANLALLWVAARIVGIGREDLRQEIAICRAMLRG